MVFPIPLQMSACAPDCVCIRYSVYVHGYTLGEQINKNACSWQAKLNTKYSLSQHGVNITEATWNESRFDVRLAEHTWLAII